MTLPPFLRAFGRANIVTLDLGTHPVQRNEQGPPAATAVNLHRHEEQEGGQLVRLDSRADRARRNAIGSRWLRRRGVLGVVVQPREPGRGGARAPRSGEERRPAGRNVVPLAGTRLLPAPWGGACYYAKTFLGSAVGRVLGAPSDYPSGKKGGVPMSQRLITDAPEAAQASDVSRDATDHWHGSSNPLSPVRRTPLSVSLGPDLRVGCRRR
jgi:hypothetical protein